MLGSIIGGIGSIVGGLIKNNADKKNAQRQEALQREFAQQGIQWKVADAKAAGIHPLYALGASTHSYAPTSVGGSGLGDGIAAAGQNIGRAIDATRSPQAKIGAIQQSIMETQLEGLGLDNDLKRARLASAIATNATRTGIPSDGSDTQFDGQGNAIGLKGPKIDINTRRDVPHPGSPEHVAGSGPSVMFVKNTTGGLSPVIPPELAESFESDPFGLIDWQIRNRVFPTMNVGKAPPPGKPGHVWEWKNGEWKQRPATAEEMWYVRQKATQQTPRSTWYP